MLFFKLIRLTLIQKLVAAFAIIGVCLITALVYAVMGLNTMHLMAADIARKDLTSATATIALRDSVIAQRRAEGRYRIFKLPEFKELYARQAEGTRVTLAMLRKQNNSARLQELERVYDRYTVLCDKVFAGQPVDDQLLKQAVEQVEAAIERLRVEQQKILEDKLVAAKEREARIATSALGLALSGTVLAMFVASLLVYSFSKSIGKLQKATHRIAAGDFDHDPHIPTGDEIGSLAEDFMTMASRLKELEQISLDASPLTRLPGNIAIERSINRRLKEGSSFAMCYIDLDNFKSYNDRYGYIKASEILKKTGEVIHEAVKALNDPDAFVGHIGGDDFVAIVDAKHAKTACQEIIRAFDAMIPSFYSAEDCAAGAIEGIDRYGVPRIFPLISVSIAALTCQPGSYATAAEIATAAAKVKDRVKESAGSNYIIVREARSGEI